ncbi:prephenate dehydrogenase [Lentimicrobium sp. S6]|uniref:prephenate dehydrogenase n=1 Tax=Lentimicrobium sp. S6 TaxID=2735872 RepID=UPI0020A6AE1F|nr:prephenate dehydrogenase [Lentimicrobium sp. S6]
MKICIIGLGLMGGSMAIDLKKRGFTKHIIGVDNNKLHAHTAEKLGLADEICDLEEGVKKADLIVLATPANVSLHLLPKILDQVEEQVITDVGSIKKSICERVKSHSKRSQYVAAHPMAGTEHSGPWAAIPNLFDAKAVIFTEAENSSKEAIEMVSQLYETLNMPIVYMSASNHDIHAAYVSHISHISSFALALTVLEKEKNEKNIFNLASGGFDSTVRLAKSSAEMWTPIFEQNSENITAVLDNYIQQLQLFKENILQRKTEDLNQMINKANSIKRVLKA